MPPMMGRRNEIVIRFVIVTSIYTKQALGLIPCCKTCFQAVTDLVLAMRK